MRNKKVRRLVGIMSMTLATAIIVGVISGYGNVNSMASSGYMVTCLESNSPNLRNNYDERNMLCKKLEYDKSNNATKLDRGLERQLNEVGVFDSELEDLDNESIEELENAENISVNICYTTVADENGEKEELTNEEISSLISESIEKGNMAYEETYSSNLLAKIGIVPTVAYADNYNNKKSLPFVSNSGAIKQIIICSQKNKGSKIVNVTYKAVWLEEAKYRSKDVCGVSFSNAQLSENSYSCKHTAEYQFHNWRTGKKTKKKLKTTIAKNSFIPDAKVLACTVDLFGDRKKMNKNEACSVYESYKNETIELKFKIEADSLKKSIGFNSHYYHTKASTTLSPSVSVGGEGISVSVTPGIKNYSEKITNNVYMQYKLK